MFSEYKSELAQLIERANESGINYVEIQTIINDLLNKTYKKKKKAKKPKKPKKICRPVLYISDSSEDD